jgi:excinuclease ABC subunit C
MSEISQSILQKLRHSPNNPGVYLMKDHKGLVIYVGKAKNLRNRLRSYFEPDGVDHFKTRRLVEQICDFDVIITQTELDALLTERSLIRSHNPKFNVLLRDDKEYPYIRVDFNEPWPRIEKVRRRKDDGAYYLGPFGSASQLATGLKAIGRIFQLIRCSRHEFAHAKRVCTYYHMKMCLGPCAIPVERDEYVQMMRNALDVLQGQNRETAKRLKEKMQVAAKDQSFELAAQYRDQLFALQKLNERQSTVVQDIADADVISCAEQNDWLAFAVLTIREGKLLGSDAFMLSSTNQSQEENFRAFLIQYYESRYFPDELILDLDKNSRELISEDLQALYATQRTHPSLLKITGGDRGSRSELCKMGSKNAQYQLEENLRKSNRRTAELRIIQQKLGLSKLPARMECIDISNLQGTNIVASNVVFIDGKAAKDQYRLYNVETVTEGPDDFESMREVVRRRLERAVNNDDAPDLLIIDGGKGQLSAAQSVMNDFSQLSIELVSLAKSHTDSDDKDFTREARRSDERIFIPGRGEPIPLTIGTPEFRVLTSIRDEAHRFAIGHHRRKRAKAAVSSELEEIKGIGPKMRQKLLLHFGSIDRIRHASLEELRAIKGLSEAAALNIHSQFRSKDESN